MLKTTHLILLPLLAVDSGCADSAAARSGASEVGAAGADSGASSSAPDAAAEPAVDGSRSTGNGSPADPDASSTRAADAATGSSMDANAAADATGRSGSGDAATKPLPTFFLGADITDQEPAPAAALDDLLAQMKSNGFNFVRLRTFVDPTASDGYDQANGYDDITHTVAFGKRIKDAGLGLLVDFHMSDNWADPSKQCIPVAWQRYTNITDLSTAVYDYVKSSVHALVDGGARPDMVQIGNETTPGMLLHICDTSGQPTPIVPAATGPATTGGWPSLGSVLKAGVRGVRDSDPAILVSFHIDRCNAYGATKSWIDGAVQQGVTMDAFGESCYQQYQGVPASQSETQNGWQTTLSQLVASYPSLRFFAAEYGPMERQINDVVFNLPDDRGLGTFVWEPTSQGPWNAAQPSDPAGTTTHALWRRSGNAFATLADLSLYLGMKADYARRL